MDFKLCIKATSQQIIALSGKLGEKMHTWNQENNAPSGGFTDRVGFIVDEIELFADVYVAPDARDGLLRTRMAQVHKDETDQELFTIVTLHFSTNLIQSQHIIKHNADVNQQTLIALLNDQNTKPSYIHVSLEAGKDAQGNFVGKRYEYNSEDLPQLTEANETEFLETLRAAYTLIVSSI
ncbi:MAG: hypothetical protein NVS3B23_07460 [Candidatus Saccharimonadales bacterium]